jgi:hypothetical protein
MGRESCTSPTPDLLPAVSDATIQKESGWPAVGPGVSVLLVLSSLLLSCARHRTITREELRAELTSAISIANATEMSIDFVSRKQSTRNFAAGQFAYLSNQLNDTANELHGASVDAGLAQILKNSRTQTSGLSSELNAVQHEIGSAEALRGSKKRVEAIRVALEQAKASL